MKWTFITLLPCCWWLATLADISRAFDDDELTGEFSPPRRIDRRIDSDVTRFDLLVRWSPVREPVRPPVQTAARQVARPSNLNRRQLNQPTYSVNGIIMP